MKSLKKYFFISLMLLSLGAIPVAASADVYYRTGYCGGDCGYRVVKRCCNRVFYRHTNCYRPCYYRNYDCGGCGYGYRSFYRWGW
jgi:hypothetical protein